MMPDRLFVLAGAGVSFPAPTGLPLWAQLRDRILRDLGLHEYAADADPGGRTAPHRRVAEGLVPEPFMSLLMSAGVPVISWLHAVFENPTPNAAHHVLAQLALGGANIWTVNFDDAIERAAASLDVIAWPEAPARPAHLLKPHGTVGGKLIIGADQVVKGLDAAWRDRLRQDVYGRTVVFIGYRGRDLDFRPVWEEVLTSAVAVLWFDFPVTDDAGAAERERKRQMLQRVDQRGALKFMHPAPKPLAARNSHLSGWPNPSWDFIVWLQDNGLAQAPADLLDEIFRRRPDVAVGPVGGLNRNTKAGMQLLLGDARAARRTYAGALVRGQHPFAAARGVAEVTVNHGSRPTAALLAATSVLPPIGRLRTARRRLLRKRVNILFNVGRHDDVIRLTASRREDDVSTLGILRAAALRMSSDLDEAVEVAAASLADAKREEHLPRIANAAFQLVFALMWAGRLVEAQASLANDLRPYAELTATRWVAWSDFITAALHIHAGHGVDALSACADALARFEGEGLVDGLVSAKIVELTARRCSSDPEGFIRARTELDDLLDRRGATYYARGSRFTAEAVALEDGEFARVHARDLGSAERSFAFVTRSPHRVHAALGHLGLSAVKQAMRHDTAAAHHAATARDQAQCIHARLIEARADELLGERMGEVGPPPEIFYP